MEFKEFKLAIQNRFNQMVASGPIFEVEVNKDELWEKYLDSYPAGTNDIYRERREHDCSACRAFVKNAGAMVSIVNGEMTTIWDIEELDSEYGVVASNLAEYIRGREIANIFLHPERSVGTDHNRELINEEIQIWHHFHVNLPDNMHCNGLQIGSKKSEYRGQFDVLLRGLTTISIDSIETVEDLISQNSLYRGDEKKSIVATFRTVKEEFMKIPAERTDQAQYFAWNQLFNGNAWVAKIRNDVIGTLLVDLSEGVDLELAVKKFEDKVSGTNYKRPTALITPKMRDQAKSKIQELGLMTALDRRYAHLEDIGANNLLFANRDTKKRLNKDVFDEVDVKAGSNRVLDNAEEITIEKFLNDVLPTATSVEVMLENRHRGNLVSLIAPVDVTARSMFKWNNPFSWSYAGDVADSIKERVKAAGGNVTGDVCCRLAWYNYDDLDFHMIEPSREEIYYGHHRSRSGGELDVDMNAGGGQTRTPVENIFYKDLHRMQDGTYQLFVHQYNKRETKDVGFDVEIDILGEMHSFSYKDAVASRHRVVVAELIKKDGKMTVKSVIPSSSRSVDMWALKTSQFQPVSAIMLSPNHWDGDGIGNKHYFFMLQGCKNDETARGFYNEFLNSELEPHRKTMELVGSKARAEYSEDQMSGLGFSSTQRNSLVVRVHGSFTRTLKITF